MFLRNAVTVAATVAVMGAGAAAAATVEGIRFGEHSGMTRVVLDVSDETPYSVDLTDTGDAVFIDLPGTDWRPMRGRQRRDGLVAGYAYESEEGGGYLALRTVDRTVIKRSFLLPPDGKDGWRIVVDLATAAGPGDIARTETELLSYSPSTAVPPRPPSRQLLPMPRGTLAGRTVSPSQAAETAPSAVDVWLRANGRQPAVPAGAPRSPNPQQALSPGQRQGGQGRQPSLEGPRSPLDQQGPYISGNLGLAFVSNFKIENGTTVADVETDSFGLMLNGAYGYRVRPNLRIEGELGYASADASDINVETTAGIPGLNTGRAEGEGDLSLWSFMLNGIYEFPNQSRFRPFVLGGLGFGVLSVNGIGVSETTIVDGDDWVGAFQFGFGLSADMNERMAVDLGYRFMITTEGEFTDRAGTDFQDNYSSHALLAGLRYRL